VSVSSQQNYSRLDRMFHRVAFSSPAVQVTAADIERSLYGRRFTSIRTPKPVFITSLPRAGTTLMLELLGQLPSFATSCYRDMPFVLAPLLWESLSRGFRKPAELAERAHADGMAVGFDSPEAFEEVLWMTAWPEKFTAAGIALWGDHEDAAEFRGLLVSHMQRIIAARSNGSGGSRRYLSKNNANIARIGLLKRLFPDAAILVPFRSPMDQAGSLLRQHLRFLEIHAEDAFARQYMEDIGHLEFGAAHRPIRFPGVEKALERYRPDTIDYWLAYWIAAFEHILRYRDSIILVSYGEVCEAGPRGVQAVASCLDLPAESIEPLTRIELHSPRAHRDTLPNDRALLTAADELYRQLCANSVALPQHATR
jgi:hypothetical protein